MPNQNNNSYLSRSKKFITQKIYARIAGRIVRNEATNLEKITANPNPFYEAPTHKAPLFSDLYHIFAGREITALDVNERDDRIDYNKNLKWYQVPYKLKHGLSSYPLDIPSQLIYTVIPLLFILATWGVSALSAYAFFKLAEVIQKAPTLLVIATSPIWLPLMIALGALAIGSAIAGIGALIPYLLTKMALFVPNLLIQKVVTPGLSALLTALTIIPVRLITSLVIDRRASKGDGLNRQNNSTSTVFKKLDVSFENAPTIVTNIKALPPLSPASSALTVEEKLTDKKDHASSTLGHKRSKSR